MRTSNATIACPLTGEPSDRSQIQLNGFALYHTPDIDHWFAPEAFEVLPDYDDVYSAGMYDSEQVQTVQRFDAQTFKRHPTYAAFFSGFGRRSTGATELLDIGCGAGRFCRAAAAEGWRVHGIDVSEESLRHCQGMPFETSCCKVEDLLQQDRRYDVITAFEVLEHLSDPCSMLRSALQLLRPGGHFFATVPNWECADVQQGSDPVWLPPVHVQFFTRSSIGEAAKRAGFENVQSGVIKAKAISLGVKGWVKRAIDRFGGLEGRPLGLWVQGQSPQRPLVRRDSSINHAQD